MDVLWDATAGPRLLVVHAGAWTLAVSILCVFICFVLLVVEQAVATSSQFVRRLRNDVAAMVVPARERPVSVGADHSEKRAFVGGATVLDGSEASRHMTDPPSSNLTVPVEDPSESPPASCIEAEEDNDQMPSSRGHACSTPSSWLRIVGRKLTVSNEGQHQLSLLGSDKLNLVTVWGRARSGKSFLLNCLMNQPGFFKVLSGEIPCTVGADLSGFFEAEECDGSSSSSVDRIGFVDVEGNGDKGKDYEALLAGPLLLVSKVVIMNWHGKMARDDMLSQLHSVALVGMEQAEAQASKEGGKKANTKPLFGHLHIVMRDTKAVDDVHSYLFEDEDEETAGDDDNLLSIQLRNTVRFLIRQSFASYQVHGLPPPVNDTRRLFKGEFTEDEVCLAFQEGVADLKAVISEQLCTPSLYGGQALTGVAIESLMATLSTREISDKTWTLLHEVRDRLLQHVTAKLRDERVQRMIIDKLLSLIKPNIVPPPPPPNPIVDPMPPPPGPIAENMIALIGGMYRNIKTGRVVSYAAAQAEGHDITLDSRYKRRK